MARVNGMPLGVGQAAFVENLQEQVENLRRGFFHFVQQHHAIGATAQRFGELAALFHALITRRRADQSGDGVLVVKFGHIQTDEGVFVVEKEGGERFGQFGLAGPARPQEEEHTNRTFGVAQSGAVGLHGVRDRFQRVVLPHHTAA